MDPPTDVLYRASGVSKRFPGAVVLDGVDFTLRHGEVHALLGENGAGKSTLIKCLTGAYRRDGGTLALEGRVIDPRSTEEAQALGIGTVYQEINLLPQLSVADNLFLGRQPRRFGLVRTAAMRRAAAEMLAGYGLAIDVAAELGSFSVAIQQIVAIARAVSLSGKVLVLDEPTASLDAQEVRMLFDVVRDLRRRGLGIIFITHFLDQVFEIADRITVLRNGRLVGSRPTAEMGRVELVTMMLGRVLEEEARTHTPQQASGGSVVASFRGFGKAGKIEPFDLDVRAGEVIGVAGCSAPAALRRRNCCSASSAPTGVRPRWAARP